MGMREKCSVVVLWLSLNAILLKAAFLRKIFFFLKENLSPEFCVIGNPYGETIAKSHQGDKREKKTRSWYDESR